MPWRLFCSSAKHLESLIRHAEAYPYERPAGSYLYDEGAVRPLGQLRLEGRVPVIAARLECGAGAARDQVRGPVGDDPL